MVKFRSARLTGLDSVRIFTSVLLQGTDPEKCFARLVAILERAGDGVNGGTSRRGEPFGRLSSKDFLD